MVLKKKFGIIGGDLRQIYVAEKLRRDGNKVEICGFDSTKKCHPNLKISSLSKVVSSSDYIIFPVPVSRDEAHINAPFSAMPILIDESLASMLKNKVVFGGIISPLMERVKHSEVCLNDYYNREDIMVLNAVPTAEGAVKLVLEESICTISGSNFLVVGYGRIGKVLAKLLKNMGARVTVSSRNFKEIAWAKIENFEIVNLSTINCSLKFDMVFNTVPAPIFNCENLSLFDPKPLIIELASPPGGISKDLAKKFDIKVIPAPGLPGKYFPQTAGEIIAKTIYKIIQEENL